MSFLKLQDVESGRTYVLKSFQERRDGHSRLANELRWLMRGAKHLPVPRVICWSDPGQLMITEHIAGLSVLEAASREDPERLGTLLGKWLAYFHSMGRVTCTRVTILCSLDLVLRRAVARGLLRTGVSEMYDSLNAEVPLVGAPWRRATYKSLLKSDCQLANFLMVNHQIIGIDFEEAGIGDDVGIDLGQLGASYVACTKRERWKPFLDGLQRGWADHLGLSLPETWTFWLGWYWLYLQTDNADKSREFHSLFFPSSTTVG